MLYNKIKAWEVGYTDTYVYVDILFLINFSMDYLCLYISAKILRRAANAKKMIPAALLGAIYSVVSVFLTVQPWIALLIDILVCVAMCAIAFHKRKQLRKTFLYSLLYFLVSMTVGGIMTALFNLVNKLNLPFDMADGDGLSVWGFALLAILAGIFAIFGGNFIFKKKEIRDCQLKILFDGKEKIFSGLSDSGNLVRDPISGRPVIIIDRRLADGFVDTRILDNFKSGIPNNSKAYSGMRIAPISTVSGKSAIVLLRADQITLTYNRGSRQESIQPDAMFALGDIGKSANGYDAIIPYSLFRG